MITKLAFVSAIAVALTGCGIHQTVQPIAMAGNKQVCIVENPAVKGTFLEVYTRTLGTKGYTVRQLAKGSSLVECPVTSTYTANWRWDLAMYMTYADITVYDKGAPAGKAVYDATRAGLNTGKFINADKKVTELVDQLFPALSGS
jgi:hypothetical protein